MKDIDRHVRANADRHRRYVLVNKGLDIREQL